MMRRIFSFVIIAAFISSCGNTGKKDVTSKAEELESAAKVEFASLVANPDSFIGKNIIVEGKVVHVCTESGKKLFIVGENPDVRLFISAGENMPKFPLELLGSQVVVEGTIAKIGGPAMAVSEGEANMGRDKKACETESAVAAQTSLADIVMDYKSHSIK